jgi:hypothetical protein
MPISGGGSGGSVGASGAINLLTAVTLAVDGTFDVTGINQSYSDLVLVLVVRATRAAPAEFLQLQLNADSTVNYDSDVMNGNGAPANSLNGTSIQISSSTAAATAAANYFSGFEVILFGYASAVIAKTVKSTSASPLQSGSAPIIESASGVWRSTAALKAGSQLRIYGRT